MQQVVFQKHGMKILPKGNLHSERLTFSGEKLKLKCTERKVSGSYIERRKKAEALRQRELGFVMAEAVRGKGESSRVKMPAELWRREQWLAAAVIHCQTTRVTHMP
jgi:chromosome condensin MukBEF MukE localization factor